MKEGIKLYYPNCDQIVAHIGSNCSKALFESR